MRIKTLLGSKRVEQVVTNTAITYFILGLIYALFHAWFYHWPALAYFSPNFYSVVFTWPFQIDGLIIDFQFYGWAGKPLL